MTTSKTYELPAPAARTSRDTYSIWFTGHSIANNGNLTHDGTVTRLRSRGTVRIKTHEGEVLSLDYNEARRVGLALLAAVEEAKTLQENR